MLTLLPERSLHHITALPQDLQLEVCELLTDPHDQASICLADPRLGLAAPVSYTHLTLPTICSV